MVLILDLFAGSPTLGAGMIFILVVYPLLWLARWTTAPDNFPPGPPRLPLLGNILNMPHEKPYLQFTKWRKQYGDLIGLKAGPSNIIILNSPELVQKLIVSRGTIYSGRPISHVIRHFLFPGQDYQPICFQNDIKLRNMRTEIKNHLTNAASLKEALPMQDRVANKLLARLRGEGDGKVLSAETSIGLWTFEVAMTGILGPVGLEGASVELYHRWKDLEHGLLVVGESGVSALYDMLPFMRHLPRGLRPGEEKARSIGKGLGDIYVDLFAKLKGFIVQAERTGTELKFPGMMARILLAPVEDASDDASPAYTESQLRSMAQFIQDAAADTTLSTALSCIMALATNREILKRAQEEVDDICGIEAEDVPTHEHIGSMSYLRACITEALRWRGPTPLLLPHRAERDDNFEGYHIPKDSMVLVNMWAISHDPELFEDPETFNPERFLDSEGKVRLLPSYPFGLGRRMCPGDQFAIQTLMVGLSKLIWAFDLVVEGPAPDLSIENGYVVGAVPAPKELPIKFVARRA